MEKTEIKEYNVTLRGKQGILKVTKDSLGKLKILYGRKKKWDNLFWSPDSEMEVTVMGLYTGHYGDIHMDKTELERIFQDFRLKLI